VLVSHHAACQALALFPKRPVVAVGSVLLTHILTVEVVPKLDVELKAIPSSIPSKTQTPLLSALNIPVSCKLPV
jgi:hypothetical protein